VAIVVVTLALTFVTLVLGELAPKRVAMQRAERWGLLVARPVAGLALLARPVIWFLGASTNFAVRLMGGDPARHREDVTEGELRDLVASQTSFTPEQRTIISGAFEIGDRTLREVLVPRLDVVAIPAHRSIEDGLAELVASCHSRAPVVGAEVDDVVGVVHWRDLLTGGGTVGDRARPVVVLPESVGVIEGLRRLQAERQPLAVVSNEYGGMEGIVTIEDLVEELVGEIYDETDRDVLGVVREEEGALVMPGTFPIHDLCDLDVHLPEGDYVTVAGLVLDRLGRIPSDPGRASRSTDGSWRYSRSRAGR
jgi:putative hemolysin